MLHAAAPITTYQQPTGTGTRPISKDWQAFLVVPAQGAAMGTTLSVRL